jgi:hypothetical protein
MMIPSSYCAIALLHSRLEKINCSFQHNVLISGGVNSRGWRHIVVINPDDAPDAGKKNMIRRRILLHGY